MKQEVEYSSGYLLFMCAVAGYTGVENTRKFKGPDSREITSLPEFKKVIYMACHDNHCQK